MIPGGDFVTLALAAATLYGLDPVLPKCGLEGGGTWLQRTLILLAIRLALFWTALLTLAGPAGAFAGGTLLASLGFLAMFGALEADAVPVVEPIVGAAPLVTVAVAAMFPRAVERLTARLVAGVGLVVIGVVLVTARPF